MPSRRKNLRILRRKNRAPRTIAGRRDSPKPPDRLAGQWFSKLVALQTRLRRSGGCPWDQEQTHASLRKFLMEETYEVLDAMESGDPKKFASELGDLLLQIVFHSILAEEAGQFTVVDVIESVHSKMIRRHPHVFGRAEVRNSGEVLKNWEQLKAAERAGEGKSDKESRAFGDDSILAGIPRSLPAVLEAYQLTRRASHIGFDWERLSGILEKLDEEKRELRDSLAASSASRGATSPTPRVEEEVGDLLFVTVNVARFLGVDPEIALNKANRKFKQRFNWMEREAARQGHPLADLPRNRKEELWNQSKARGASR